MSPIKGREPEHGLAPGRHATTVDGLTLQYHVAGAGPVCVVHPGGPGVGWEYLRVPLLEQDATTVYLEPLGTGDSTRLADPAGYSLELYTHCLRGLLEHLGSGPVHVLGHSHGGFVALRLAASAPELMAGQILYDTGARTDAEWSAALMSAIAALAERHADRPELPDILAALEEEAAVQTDAEATAVFRRQFPFYFADYWGREAELAALRSTARLYAGPMRGVEPGPYDVRPQLSTIAVPTLIIAGRHDPILGPRWAEELHAGIPGSDLVILEQSAHMGHVEEAEAFAAAVADFIHASVPA